MYNSVRNIISKTEQIHRSFITSIERTELEYFENKDLITVIEPKKPFTYFSIKSHRISNTSVEKCNYNKTPQTNLIENKIDCPKLADYSHIQASFELHEFDYDLYGDSKIDSTEFIMILEESQDFKKIRHELVALACTGEFYKSDAKLSLILEGSNLTPDFIIETETHYHIVEIGTTSLSDVKGKYDMKTGYYMNALKDYKGTKQIFIHGVICNSSKLLSSLDLSYAVNNAIYMYQAGELLTVEAVESLNWVNNERQQEANSILKMLESWKSGMSDEEIPEMSDDVMVITKADKRYLDKRISMLKEDKDHKTNLFNNLVQRANKELQAKMKIQDPQDLIDLFVDDINNESKSGPIRRDNQTSKKAVVQQAFFCVLKTCEDFSDWPYVPFASFWSQKEDDTMNRLYYQAFKYSFENKEYFRESKTDIEQYKEALNPEAKTPSQLKERLNYHRVNLSVISQQDWMKLAEKGIKGKKYKFLNTVKDHYFESKAHFTLDAYIDDIDDFINNKDIWKLNGFVVDGFKNHEDLYEEAAAHFPNKWDEESESFIKTVKKTQIGNACDMMGLIMEELNLSMNHPMKDGRMELKKIKNYHVYLLIKPTTQTKNLFYSVLARAQDIITFGSCFKGWKDIGGGYSCTEFVSINRHHLSYLLSCGEKLSVILAVNIEIFRNSFTGNISNLKGKTIRQANLQLLCYLEGKQQTSANIQQLRYMYMESCKQNPIWPCNPLKVFSKLSNNPRNRLLIWFYIKMISVFSKYHGEISPIIFLKPKRNDDIQSLGSYEEEEISRSLSKDRVKGLFSLVTKRGRHDEFTEFRQALNLFYTCNLKNKENRDKDQNIFQLFDKIIEEEEKVYSSNQNYFGKVEPPTDHIYKSHEYSPDSILLGSLMIKDKLDSKVNGDYGKELERKFHKQMNRKTSDFFATFRASGIQPPDQYEATYDKHGVEDLKKVRTTKKAIVNMSDLIREHGFGVNPYTDLDKLLKLAGQGVLYVQIDEKDQIGGFREIGILKIVHRLLIHFLESLCRLIDEELPQEMLTNPDKIQTIDNHYYKLAILTSDSEENLTANSSDDASRWAQGFLMRMFHDSLYPILPVGLMNFVTKIFNLYVKKQIALPQKLLRKFHKYPDLRMPETGKFVPINELKDQYLGKVKRDWLVPSKYHAGMRNRSNMVQGIMHFTSSFLHACRTMLVANIIRLKFEVLKKLGLLPPEAKLIITNLISSDDSSSHFSIIYKLNEALERKGMIALFLTWAHALDEASYGLFGMKFGKEKSVNGNFSSVAEFNSIWSLAGNTLIAALIKYAFQTVCIKNASSLIQRQEIMNGMITQVREAGGPGILAAICQRCQMRIHYAAFGMNTSPLFKYFKRDLILKPSASLGFFVLCPEQICGVFGFRFSEWLFISSNVKSRQVTKWLYENNKFQMSDTGVPTVKIELKLGNAALKKKMLSELRIPENWSEELERSIKNLYDPVSNLDQVKFKIIYKGITVDVGSFGMETSGKMFMTSIYALNNRCITVRNSKDEIFGFDDIPELDDIHREIGDDQEELLKKFKKIREQILRDQKNKTSLLSIINEIELKDALDESAINFLFPEFYFFKTIKEKLEELSDYSDYEPLSYTSAFRFIMIKRPRLFGKENNLMNAVRTLWFDFKTFGTMTEKLQVLSLFKTHYNFLNKNYTEMTENKNSPFYLDHLGLYNFIISQVSKENKYLVLGPVKTNLGFESTIDNLISSSFKHGYSLRTKHAKLTNNETDLKDKIFVSLNYIEVLPMLEDQKLECAELLLINTDSFMPDRMSEKSTFFRRVGQNSAALSVIQKFIKDKKYRGKLLINDIREAKGGMLGEWSKVQLKDEQGKHFGSGIFKGSIDKENFIITIYDNDLKSIRVKSNKSLNKIWSTIVDLLVDMRITSVSREFSSDYKSSGYITKGSRLRDFQFQTSRPKPQERQDIALVYIDDEIHKLTFETLSLRFEKKGKILRLAWIHPNQRTNGGSAITCKVTDTTADLSKIRSEDFKFCELDTFLTPWINDFIDNKKLDWTTFFNRLSSFQNYFNMRLIDIKKNLFLRPNDKGIHDLVNFQPHSESDIYYKIEFDKIMTLKSWLRNQLTNYLKDVGSISIKEKESEEVLEVNESVLVFDMFSELLEPDNIKLGDDLEDFLEMKNLESDFNKIKDLEDFGAIIEVYAQSGVDSFGYTKMKTIIRNRSILFESRLMDEIYNSIVMSLGSEERNWQRFFFDNETYWKVTKKEGSTEMELIMWVLDRSKTGLNIEVREFRSSESFKRMFNVRKSKDPSEQVKERYLKEELNVEASKEISKVSDPILHSSVNISKQALSNRNVFSGKEEIE